MTTVPHWQCKNCKRMFRKTYECGSITCSGIVKNTNRRCDVIRICDTFGGKEDHKEVSIDEAITLMTAISTAVNDYVFEDWKRYRVCGECTDIDCENGGL